MSFNQSIINLTSNSDISQCPSNATNILDVNVSSSLLDDTAIAEEASDASITEHSLSITLDGLEQLKLKALRKHRKMLPNETLDTDISLTTAMEQFADMCRKEAAATETELQISDATAAFLTTDCDDAIEEEEMEASHALPVESNFFARPFFEVGRRLWESSPSAQCYTKGCRWSPDGTCILVPVNYDGMHVIELPSDLYTPAEVSPQRTVSQLPTAVHVKEGGIVYDYAWYPFMNSSSPESCCWIASRQHEPIHMWDAFSGELRCTYRGYDEVDEVEAAISVAFSLDGLKVMGGYKKSIKLFDTNVPGRDCSTLPVKSAVSCMALTEDNGDTVTTGTWKGYINHYDLRAPKLGALFTLGGHTGGITSLRYTEAGGTWMLYSGARKDNKILQWDMRNYTEPVRKFKRKVDTNQRISFDVSADERWLVSGGTDGKLLIWDLNKTEDPEEVLLHKDCCNSVNFHPTRPILATSAGQFHFMEMGPVEQTMPVTKIIDYENSLLFLWIGQHGPSE